MIDYKGDRMPVAELNFETSNARRYLVQLCKHFAHKVEVSYTDEEGHAALPTGPAILKADDTNLFAQVEAEDAEGLGRAKHIIGDHLRRFAFREEPGEFEWKDLA